MPWSKKLHSATFLERKAQRFPRGKYFAEELKLAVKARKEAKHENEEDCA